MILVSIHRFLKTRNWMEVVWKVSEQQRSGNPVKIGVFCWFWWYRLLPNYLENFSKYVRNCTIGHGFQYFIIGGNFTFIARSWISPVFYCLYTSINKNSLQDAAYLSSRLIFLGELRSAAVEEGTLSKTGSIGNDLHRPWWVTSGQFSFSKSFFSSKID